MTGMLARILGAFVVAACMALPVAAQPLRMAVQADSSLDPHYIFLDSNVALHRHIFSGLTQVDTAGRAVPDLARA